MGIMFLATATFVGAPIELPSGLPETNISTGEHKVAFVYVAGENVSVGIEKVDDKTKNEHLCLYQFPLSVFGSDVVNTHAKKLVVVESGNFKKLVLK